ncbi:MAG: hypothetical protein ABSH24_15540 [Bryobacteraceae bacterium]
MAQPVSQVGGVSYQQRLPNGFIVPGVFQFSASGSPVQIQGSLTVGSPIQIQTAPLAAGTVVASNQNFTVNWTGDDAEAIVTVTLVAGTGLAAVADYAQADASAGSITFQPVCADNPVRAGGNGVICSFGLPSTAPLEIILDVTPASPNTTSLVVQGITGAVQAAWDYRYEFGGLTLQ